jgi:hypothetical protein
MQKLEGIGAGTFWHFGNQGFQGIEIALAF